MVEHINYKNWPQLVGEDLYNITDGVIIHYVLCQSVDEENKQATHYAPILFEIQLE